MTGIIDGLDTTEPAYPQVSAGVAWLDEHHPGWRGRIDPGTLVLSDATCCVLCQLSGIPNYYEAVHTLGWATDISLGQASRKLGFYVPYPVDLPFGCDESAWYASADRLWKAAAAERVRANAAQPGQAVAP